MIRTLLAASLAALISTGAAAQSAAQIVPAPAKTVVPADRLNTGWWADRHRAILAMIAQHPRPDVILLGDSITQNYEKASPPDEDFAPTWQRYYAPRHALNLGFSGDTTSNLLWRLQHGEVDGLQPKVAIVLIGTNDTGFHHRTADQTRAGISAVISDLEQRLPQTRILLLALLPSAISPEKSATDETVNAAIAADVGNDPRVRFLDIGNVFRNADHTVNSAIFYDPRLSPPRPPLHPDTLGQAKMAEAIEPVLAAMLASSLSQPAATPPATP